MSEAIQLKTSSLHLEYNLHSGRACLFTPSSTPVFLHATAGACFPHGEALVADARYTRRCSLTACPDPGMAGEQLTISCVDTAQQVNLDVRLTLLRDRPGAIFEVSVTNVSSQPLRLSHAEPLRALLHERSGCFFGAERIYSRVHRVLRNGYLYSDPGDVIDIAWQGRRDITSFWNMAFYIPASQETLVVGYLDNQHAEGQISAVWDMSRPWRHGQAAFDLTARSLYSQTFVLPPGTSISSGRFLVLLAADPFSGLEAYADMCGQLHHVRLNPIINGWCSWFYMHTQATEAEQIHNAAFIAGHLKPYGLTWVQIDDGYQRTFGDWQANHLYPHGMRWLATEIRRLGLQPGIWLAPYAVSEDAPLVQQHPEWLAHDASGALQVTASTRAKYILDITHPGAQRWLRELIETVVQDWGYDFLKIDFVEWTLLAIERYYDPAISRAQAYRLGSDIMRAAMGPHRHLLDCGPGPITVGLCDSMRIEQDLPRNTWEQYTKHASSTAPAMAKRYYFHRRMWINDADHIGLALLTIPQAQAVASLIALSGGTTISGDCLYTLDATRLAIFTKVFPAYGKAARPLDLFEHTHPALFVLPIATDFGHWWVVRYFNWDEHATVTRELELSRLGLSPQQSYLVYAFWTQHLLTDRHQQITLQFPPASVHLLAIHERRGHPQVVGTDRHYTQGAVELQQVEWEPTTRTLSGTALGAPGLSWTLTIYVPEEFTWSQEQNQAARGHYHVTVLSYTEKLLCLRLHFTDTDRLPWACTFALSPSTPLPLS